MSIAQPKSKTAFASQLQITPTQKSLFNSFIASVIANTSGIIAGHPLDTIIVRMQLSKTKVSVRQCTQQAFKKEGVSGVFKGLLQPVIGTIPMTAIVFIAQDYVKIKLDKSQNQMSHVTKTMIGGSVGGFCSLSVAVPVDLLKSRAQMTRDGKLNYPKEIRNILSQQGLRGMYRGFWAFALRDIPGWGVYFSAFEKLKVTNIQVNNYLGGDEKTQNKRMNLLTLNAGGIAGALSWLVGIPQDIIRKRQQTHRGLQPLTISQAIMQINEQKGGYKSFFKGISPSLARGYMVNAITLPMYDAIRYQLSNNSE